MLLSLQHKVTFAFLFAVIAVICGNPLSSCTTTREERGVCVPILTCDTTVQILKTSPRPLPPSVVQFVQRSYCGTFNDIHHVCCAINSVSRVGDEAPQVDEIPTPTTSATTTTTTARSEIDSNIRPSVDKSNAEFRAGMAILQATKCGKSDADRVANGVDASLSEYPWMALLVYSDGLETSLSCGGSLITDQYVLTAAHCIVTDYKILVSVRLGEHDLGSTIDCVGIAKKSKCAPPIQEIDIEEAIYHKDYSRRTVSNDIGLLRLVSKAIIRSNVKPICLPITETSATVDLPRMIIAGWGRLETGTRSNVLQKAVVPIKDIKSCQRVFTSIQLTNKQLCAGGEDEVDACKGDSGGPMFFSTRYRLGARFVQYGIVSAGSTLCGSNFPGIYVKVTSYLDWIISNIRS